MADTARIPLLIKGQYSAGDPGLTPPGQVRVLANMLRRPGRWVKRPPAIAESSDITSTSQFVTWDDFTNGIPRIVAFYASGGTFRMRVKDTAAETYGAQIDTGATSTATNILSFTNYRGSLYFPTYSTRPTGLYRYDGTSVTSNPLGGEALFPRVIQAFIDRLFLGYVSASVVNQLGTTVAYDSTAWTATNVTTTNITNGSSVTSRITPTDTTTASIRKADVYTVAASTTDTKLAFRSDLRNQSPTYEMPMTLEVYYSQPWVADTVMAVGAIRVPTTLNGYRYRVTAIAGDFKTDASTEPTWPTTVGTTVVDDQVTWICDGKEQLASQGITLPTLTAEPEPLSYVVCATIPPMPASAKVGVRIKFGSAAVSTIELAPVDISFRDGVTDGVGSKRCFGQQLTVGQFLYPFFNQQSSATATIELENDIYFTETSNPNQIDSNNYYRLTEQPGRVTAMAVIGERLVVWKSRGMWVFQGTDDPDNPLQKERFFSNFGCLGAQAWAVFEGKLYFADEKEVYVYTPGGLPEPIAGDGMREEIIDRFNETSASQVCLTVHEKDRDLYIGTDTFTEGLGPGYVMDIDTGAWSTLEIENTGAFSSVSLKSLVYYPVTQNVYGVYNTGSSSDGFRFDFSETNSDDTVPTGATEAKITWALEAENDRDEIHLEGVAIWLYDTAETTFTVTVQYGEDTSITKTNTVTAAATNSTRKSRRVLVPLRQTAPAFLISVSHTANSGAAAFAVSRAEAIVRRIGKERVISNPTAGAASL